MLTPNLGARMRVFFMLSGVALAVVPWVLGVAEPWSWIIPMVGVVAIVEGVAGW